MGSIPEEKGVAKSRDTAFKYFFFVLPVQITFLYMTRSEIGFKTKTKIGKVLLSYSELKL